MKHRRRYPIEEWRRSVHAGETVLGYAAWVIAQKEADKYVGQVLEVSPIVYEGNTSRYSVKAEIVRADNLYHEMAVAYADPDGELVADIYFTVDRTTGEPRVLVKGEAA